MYHIYVFIFSKVSQSQSNWSLVSTGCFFLTEPHCWQSVEVDSLPVRDLSHSTWHNKNQALCDTLNPSQKIWVVSPKNRGVEMFFPPKWMVKIMETTIKMDDLGGKNPYFWKHPYDLVPCHIFIDLQWPTRNIKKLQASNALTMDNQPLALCF